MIGASFRPEPTDDIPMRDLSTISQFRNRMAKQPGTRYVAAIAMFALAFTIRVLVDAALPPGFPYLTFFPAIVIATFFFGTGPGVLCAVLSGVAAWYFFIPPFSTFALSGSTLLALIFFVFIVAVDIFVIDRMFASRDKLEEARREALYQAHQRELLFKEMQHRVGNNLNMISALLNLQSRSLSDETSRFALNEASRRIALIADINRMFYDPAHADGVIDDAFVQELAGKCLDAAGAAEQVRMSVSITPVALRQEKFLPVALIMTECMSNALEHGVGLEGRGEVSVVLRRDPAVSMLELLVKDNGAGLPKDFDLAKARSIGLVVVRAFATQLGGTFEMFSEGGTVCRLRFPEPDRAEDPEAGAQAAREAGLARPAGGELRPI